jgi:hypothetical protein
LGSGSTGASRVAAPHDSMLVGAGETGANDAAVTTYTSVDATRQARLPSATESAKSAVELSRRRGSALINAVVSTELAPGEAARVARHLATCEELAARSPAQDVSGVSNAIVLPSGY